MKKRMFLSVATALVMSLAFTTVAFAGVNGSLTVAVDGYHINDPSEERANLLGLIQRAEALRDATTVMTGEMGLARPTDAQMFTRSRNNIWATQGARNVFQAAIDAAIASHSTIGSFRPNDEFDITVGITGNTGFAGMVMEIGIPNELRLVQVSNNADFHNAAHPIHDYFGDGFVQPACPDCPGGDDDEMCEHGCPVRPINEFVTARQEGGRRYFYAGWAGRQGGVYPAPAVTNFSGNGDLFTFRVSVRPGTTPQLLSDITISIANAIDDRFERPTNANGDGLNISLPCGTPGWTGAGMQIGYMGRVTVLP